MMSMSVRCMCDYGARKQNITKVGNPKHTGNLSRELRVTHLKKVQQKFTFLCHSITLWKVDIAIIHKDDVNHVGFYITDGQQPVKRG